MLIVEWHEYSATASSPQPCSMQVVMYDVTNEFEFHYDDSCSVVDIAGLAGHRKDFTNYQDIKNIVSEDNGNPHDFNIRVTNGLDGYAYEYFDLGISNPGYLPMASSSQEVIPADWQSFRTDIDVLTEPSSITMRSTVQAISICPTNFHSPSGEQHTTVLMMTTEYTLQQRV